jgi:multiple sugar transport system substrate-binding protein
MGREKRLPDRSRRKFLKQTALAAAGCAFAPPLLLTASAVHAAQLELQGVDIQAAAQAKKLAANKDVTLTIMEPSGSLGNIKPVAERWSAATGIKIKYVEVPLEEIDQKMMLEAISKAGSFDLALPASFGLPDLVTSGIVHNLDELSGKYQPPGYTSDMLYTVGNYYKGRLYGYGTDGDTYVMFYLKDWLDNPDEKKRFADKHGYELQVPKTWEQLDQMMAFFHRPDRGMYGGALFRTRFFIAWEWWVRFHAKGYYPFGPGMKPQINNDAGVQALAELVAASKYLYPGARSNGLFENFQAFGQGGKFCNIGWGGTQKYLNSDKSSVKGELAFGPMPGGVVEGQFLSTPYFNWGWNYVVSSLSPNKEIAYLFTLYAVSPVESTIAIRDQNGYFDPFRKVHYKDPWIIRTYGEPFLAVHEASMANSMPDLYLRGHGEYFDALRENVQAADVGQKTPKQALNDAAKRWDKITDRMNRGSQQVQWDFLKSHYPPALRNRLKG